MVPTSLSDLKKRKIITGRELISWKYEPSKARKVGVFIFAVILFILAVMVSSGNALLSQYNKTFFFLFFFLFIIVNTGAHPVYYLVTTEGLWHKTNPVIRPGQKRPKRMYLLFRWEEIEFVQPLNDRLVAYRKPFESWFWIHSPKMQKKLFKIEIKLPREENADEIKRTVLKCYVDQNNI